MHVSIKPLLLNLLLSLMLAVEAWSAPLQSLDSIEQAAYVYAMEHVQTDYDMPRIVVSSLDSRLRLQQCEHELEAFTAQNKVGLGNQTIGVKCDSSVPWSVYVSVVVKVFKPVVVTTKALAAKHIITSVDVMLKRIDVASLRQGYLTDAKQLIGQQLKYAVPMGAALSQNKVKPEKIVRRGDLITLLAEVGEMEVRMNGRALSDASLGQRVQVKNSSSKRVVEGIVDAPGIVRVNM